MKRGKKIAAMRQQRTRQHQEGISARNKKMSEPEKGYKFPGSNNLHK